MISGLKNLNEMIPLDFLYYNFYENYKNPDKIVVSPQKSDNQILFIKKRTDYFRNNVLMYVYFGSLKPVEKKLYILHAENEQQFEREFKDFSASCRMFPYTRTAGA